MDITIKIEAPALVDAVNALAVALAGNIELLLDGPGARASVTETAKNVTNKAETVTKTAKNVTDDAKTETKTAKAPTFTLEQVRAKLADLARSGKQAEVKALLGKFGVKKLTEVPAEKYPELMKEAEAI